jgi:hypothetical protein
MRLAGGGYRSNKADEKLYTFFQCGCLLGSAARLRTDRPLPPISAVVGVRHRTGRIARLADKSLISRRNCGFHCRPLANSGRCPK